MSVTKMRIFAWAMPWVAFIWAGPASADWELNLTQGVTPVSQAVYDLHMIVLWVVTAIAALVFAIMFWSVFKFRKSKGAVAEQFHDNTFLEVLWTVVPIIILVVLAVPATKLLIKMEQTGDAEMTVKVTGYQWKWKYDYLDEGFSFFSNLDAQSNEARQLDSGIDPASVENYLLDVDNPIVLPVETKIRILTTANDVIHAWWVPALGWKRDAIPGFVNDNWTYIEKPGVYRGQCAELCGKDHAFMPIVLKAVSKEEYAQWVAGQVAADAVKKAEEASGRIYSLSEQMSRGESVYNASCAACHQANGQGIPGAFPSLVGTPIVKGSVEGHIDIVLKGKPGTAMTAFGSQLSDRDLAAVVTYERNAWGNEQGEVVQSADVKSRR